MLYAPIYSRTPSPPPVFILLPSWQIFSQSGQKGAKVNIYFLVFVSPSYFARQQTAKSKHIFGRWAKVGSTWGRLLACFHRVHLCGLAGFRGCPLLSWRVPSFCPLSCFAPEVLGMNMPLFAILRGFLARFYGFVWVCVGLVVCVACGVFVCVSG